MMKRYDEIMGRIQLSGEARDRILRNIREYEPAPAGQSGILRLRARQWTAIAACFAAILLGALTLPSLLRSGQEQDTELLAPYGGIYDVESLEALAAAVGFDVPEPEGLPFSPETVTYTVFYGDMAQITYEGEGQTALFRKSTGSDDNSGDYTDYPALATITAGDVTATLKGTGDLYTLAVWSDGGFSYSLSLSDGLSMEEWAALIAGIG